MKTCCLALLLAAGLLPCRVPAATIWVEGEKPVRSTMNRHPWWYDQVKRDQLSGGDFISNLARDQSRRGRVRVHVPRRRARTSSGSGPIPCRPSSRTSSTTGPWTAIDLKQQSQRHRQHRGRQQARPAVHRLDQASGEVALRQGGNTVRVPDGQQEQQPRLPRLLRVHQRAVPAAGASSSPARSPRPCQRGPRRTRAGSPSRRRPIRSSADSGFDLRSLNEKYAGDGGFIGVKDGQFVHTKTGRAGAVLGRQRPAARAEGPRERCGQCARLLAKYGVNLVRVHGGYFDENGTSNPAGRAAHHRRRRRA